MTNVLDMISRAGAVTTSRTSVDDSGENGENADMLHPALGIPLKHAPETKKEDNPGKKMAGQRNVMLLHGVTWSLGV